MRVPWTARRSNQSILKESSPEYSLEGLMLSSNTLATWCKELTLWKRPWCWERLGAGGEGDDRGWDDWMASPTWWPWVWASSGRQSSTGKPGVLRSMGPQRAGHDWAMEQPPRRRYPGTGILILNVHEACVSTVLLPEARKWMTTAQITPSWLGPGLSVAGHPLPLEADSRQTPLSASIQTSAF